MKLIEFFLSFFTFFFLEKKFLMFVGDLLVKKKRFTNSTERFCAGFTAGSVLLGSTGGRGGKSRKGAESAAAAAPWQWREQSRGLGGPRAATATAAAQHSSSSRKGGWSPSCHLPEGGEGGRTPHFLCFSSLSLLLALLSVWLLGLLLRYILSMALRASVR